MKSRKSRDIVLKEILLTLRQRPGRRRISVDVDNCYGRDRSFMRAIASAIAWWYSCVRTD